MAGRSSSCTLDVAARCRRAARAAAPTRPATWRSTSASRSTSVDAAVAVDRLDHVAGCAAARASAGPPAYDLGRPRTPPARGAPVEPEVRPDHLVALLELGQHVADGVDGIAKLAAPSPSVSCELTPTTRPSAPSSGPPDVGRLDHRVGLRAVRRSGSRRAPRSAGRRRRSGRCPPSPATPFGLPTAITWSPGRTALESPSSSGRRSSPSGSTASTARSVSSSLPSTRAGDDLAVGERDLRRR